MPRESHVGLRASSAVDPNEAMIASQQKHIDDLVSRNKTLDHTITKLRAAVAQEKEQGADLLAEERKRTADAIAQIQERWKEERTEWRDGCESLQASYRIAHLRTAVDLDRERFAVLEAKDALRREKLARMQRDYRLVMFQAKELELEERVAQLQRELELAAEEREDAVDEVEERMQETAAVLEARCAELAEQLKELAEEQARAIKEKEKAEVRLSHSQPPYCSRHLVLRLGSSVHSACGTYQGRKRLGTLGKGPGTDRTAA